MVLKPRSFSQFRCNRINLSASLAFAELKEIFNEFDRDGNGTISKSELRQAFQCRGMNPTMRDCKKWIEEVDVDGKYYLTFRSL